MLIGEESDAIGGGCCVRHHCLARSCTPHGSELYISSVASV